MLPYGCVVQAHRHGDHCDSPWWNAGLAESSPVGRCALPSHLSLRVAEAEGSVEVDGEVVGVRDDDQLLDRLPVADELLGEDQQCAGQAAAAEVRMRLDVLEARDAAGGVQAE